MHFSAAGNLLGKGSDKENLMALPGQLGRGKSPHSDLRAMAASNRGNNSLNKTPYSPANPGRRPGMQKGQCLNGRTLQL